jgi:hypothetical protein
MNESEQVKKRHGQSCRCKNCSQIVMWKNRARHMQKEHLELSRTAILDEQFEDVVL